MWFFVFKMCKFDHYMKLYFHNTTLQLYNKFLFYEILWIGQFQNTELKHRCDEFYFLTDAKQHIFEHFPDKKRWQLLNRPITLDQFMALPIVKSPFFNSNLSFKRNYADILQTKKGKVSKMYLLNKNIFIKKKL